MKFLWNVYLYIFIIYIYRGVCVSVYTLGFFDILKKITKYLLIYISDL